MSLLSLLSLLSYALLVLVASINLPADNTTQVVTCVLPFDRYINKSNSPLTNKPSSDTGTDWYVVHMYMYMYAFILSFLSHFPLQNFMYMYM